MRGVLIRKGIASASMFTLRQAVMVRATRLLTSTPLSIYTLVYRKRFLMIEDVFPRRNLPAAAEPWGRKHDEVVRQLVRNYENLKLATQGDNRANAGQMGVVGRQIETLSNQQQTLASQQDTLSNQQSELNSQVVALSALASRLEDAGKVYSASSGATNTGASWFPSPPSVSASSMSRRFRITVSGGAAGGQALFTFSTTGYPRDRALGGSASAILSRVAAFGGASMAGSAYGSWIVTMPTTGTYTFTAQANGADNFVSVVGLSIQVEPLL